jgi:Barstar (barnase inhibitor)
MIIDSVPFKFVANFPSYDTATVFYAHLDPEIGRVSELLNAIYYLLWFPGYFGFNWDALYDCLRDLNWIPHCQVVLVHSCVPKISEEDLKVYLAILRDSVLDWGVNEDHSLEIIFPASDEFIIRNLLTAE